MVYHGPSAGCKACRTRRVKCDQGRPSCHNCLRRHQLCPGYADVFDGAHRSQNNVVIRKIERQNAARQPDSSRSSPSSNGSLDLTPTSSSTSSSDLRLTKPQGPFRWVIYSATKEEQEEEYNQPLQLENTHHSRLADLNARNTRLFIPQSLKQNSEDASINFFFRHYTGTIYDPHVDSSVARLWQTLYLASSANSPIRLATAAVTVNITMMWSFRGCDARPARKLFTQALAATREAISNPSEMEKDMDELLMTILIFDLYDALILHYVQNAPSTYGKHKDGALALVKHRGPSNYASPVSQALANSARHAFLDYCLSNRVPMPTGSDDIFPRLSVQDGKATQLDLLAQEIISTQARLWTLRREKKFAASSRQRKQVFEEIIADAIRIDELFMAWKRSITHRDWLPLYVPREEVAPSIVAAGFYGTRCAVWIDLVFAEVSNWHASRRVSTLQMIRQALADEPSLLADPKYSAYLAKANATVQSLVDGILETVPSHLGDTVTVRVPIYSSEILLPYKIISDPLTGETRSIPDLEGSDYKMRAAASGGWTIFAHLIDIYRLMEPEDDAEPILLRDGQVDWIKGQVKRLQTIFLFCDPVWFKRIPRLQRETAITPAAESPSIITDQTSTETSDPVLT